VVSTVFFSDSFVVLFVTMGHIYCFESFLMMLKIKFIVFHFKNMFSSKGCSGNLLTFSAFIF